MNFGFLSLHMQSILWERGFNFWYQAKLRIKRVNPINNGLYGSIQAKVDEIPATPEVNDKTGVIQHIEAKTEVKRPERVAWLDVFIFQK